MKAHGALSLGAHPCELSGYGDPADERPPEPRPARARGLCGSPPPPGGLQTPQAPPASLPQAHLSGWPSAAALPLSPWPNLPWLSLPGPSCCPLPSPGPLRPVPPLSQGSPHPFPVWPSHPSQSVILALLVTPVTSYLVFTDVCTCLHLPPFL